MRVFIFDMIAMLWGLLFALAYVGAKALLTGGACV
jgi:hypothetical protein